MRRAAATDRNQAEIVAALRVCGATVQPLHSVGQGCPDILVGYNGANYFLEIKDGYCLAVMSSDAPDEVDAFRKECIERGAHYVALWNLPEYML